MELTLKRLLEQAEFKKYRGKGYDPVEVDDFMDKAAAMAGKVEVQLTQAIEQTGAAGGPSASPADIEAEVERRVAERVAEIASAAPSAPSEDEIAEEARRTLAMAQRTADAAMKEARADAERIVSEAEERATATIETANAEAEASRAAADAHGAEARAEVDAFVSATRAEVEAEATRERREARQRLALEIGELEGTRENLRADVHILERHVEEQRSQLGSTLAELQQLLDDPAGFRMAPVPALADPALPDFSDLDASPEDVQASAVASSGAAADDEPAADEPAEVPAGEVVTGSEDDTLVTGEAATVDAVLDADEGEVEPIAVPPAPEFDAAEVFEAADEGGATEPAPTEADGSFARVPLPVEDDDGATPGALAFSEVDHEVPDVLHHGPPTEPVSTIEIDVRDADDDPFLAELRKAISDDEPLGPRDELPSPNPESLFGEDDRRGWRFGRRH